MPEPAPRTFPSKVAAGAALVSQAFRLRSLAAWLLGALGVRLMFSRLAKPLSAQKLFREKPQLVSRPAAPAPADGEPARQANASEKLRAVPDASFSWRALWPLLKSTYAEWKKAKAPRMGAALAYYAIFSIAPLLVIAIAIAGLGFGADAARGAIGSEAKNMVGPETAGAIQEMIAAANRPGTGAFATIIGVIVLLFGASGVFGEMQDALNTIWEVKPNPKGGLWQTIRDRFLSFSMVGGIGFLLLVSLVISTALSAVSKFWNAYVPLPGIVLQGLNLIVSFVVVAAFFAMIFKVLPAVKIAWRDVWIGAGLTSVLFTLGKFLISLYIGRTTTSSGYGATGASVVLVMWIYYSAQILYFGAEFTRRFAIQYGSRPQLKSGAVGSPHNEETARI